VADTNVYRERYGVIRNGRIGAIGQGNDPKRILESCAHDRAGDYVMILNQMKRISLLWRRFTPLEEFLLDVLQRELPEEARCINQQRIDRINRVSRPLDRTEIMFYQMRWGKDVVDEEPLFPCRSQQDLILADIQFSPCNSSGVWRSQVNAVCGIMFSITTRPSPKAISFSKHFVLRSVELVDDPMQESPPTLLSRLREGLPSDFSAVAPTSVSGWSVFAESDVYAVHLNDGDYLVLAERGGEASFLGVRVGDRSKTVYYLPHDGSPKKTGSTLKEAIEGKS